MSVILEFSMFPTDKGTSVSRYVSQVVRMVRDSGFEYQLTGMSTLVETTTVAEALQIVEKAYDILEPHSERVYSCLKMDIQKNKNQRLRGKVQSVEAKIGEVNK